MMIWLADCDQWMEYDSNFSGIWQINKSIVHSILLIRVEAKSYL